MTDVSRIPTDLEWTAANGAHERLPIGRIIRDQATEIERLRKRLKQCEASLSTWDDHCDSRYWTEYPDAREAMDALNQQSTPRPMTGHFDSLTPEQQSAALNNKDADV